MTNSIIVGADLGNATTTILTAGGSAFFPSIVASVGVGSYTGGKVRRDSHHIQYKGKNALVGSIAVYSAGARTLLSRGDDVGARYTDDRSLYCLLAGVASVTQDEEVDIMLATGAPLSIFEAYSEKIKRFYKKSFEFEHNGVNRKVNVSDVQVYGEGREVVRLLSEEELKGNVAIHDLGGKTWNVIFYKNGMLVRDETFDLGIERLLDQMKSLVVADPGTRWALQCEMRDDPESHKEIRKTLKGLMNDGLGLIESSLTLGAAHSHLLIGGGAIDLKSVVEARYKKPVRVVNDTIPEQANATAYLKAAAEKATK